MTNTIKFTLMIAIFFWASAFVGIRAALMSFSPEGLALLRFMIAAACIGIFYFCLPTKTIKSFRDIAIIMSLGAIGIGIYNITLNHGELTVSSGVASFIASQTPVFSALIAVLLLNEKLTTMRILGLSVSMLGVFLMTVVKDDGFAWDPNIIYLLLATLSGSVFTIGLKSFYQKYHPLEVTTFGVWGGTLFLLTQMNSLYHDLHMATVTSIATVAYLGVFPGAIAYVAWGYILSKIPVIRAASFLYFMPFLAALLGWLYLGEVLQWQAMVGGLFAVVGVMLVNKSYQVNFAGRV